MADEKRDLRQELADRLIAQIEQGTARWQRPWEAGEVELAVNFVTGKPYRGVNQEFLMMLSPDPSDPRWMTLKQANAQGWSIKEGEHGVPIEKWTEYVHKLTDEEKAQRRERLKEAKSRDGMPLDVDVLPDDEKRMGVKYYNVFHASQIEGIPPLERPERTHEVAGTPDDRIPRLAENMGVVVQHVDGGSRAFYQISEDRVTLPAVDQFETAAGHDTVFLHELSHATRHGSRLSRESGPFGSPKYAIEELRAEMSAAMTATSLGIGFTPAAQDVEEGRDTQNTAAYLASWLKALPDKERKQTLMTAIKDAQGISDYLLERTPERDRYNLDLGLKESKEMPDFEPVHGTGFTLSQNREKAGLEVKFVAKPDPEVLDGLKSGGFRWSRKESLWYARDTEKSRGAVVNTLHVDGQALGMGEAPLDPELVDYLKQQVSIDDYQTRVAVAQDHAQQDPDKASEWAVLLRGDPHGYAKAVGRDDVEADTMCGAATLLEQSVKREQEKMMDKEDRKGRELQPAMQQREEPRLVSTLRVGQERYDVTINEKGVGKLAVTLGDNKQVMPLVFTTDKYRNPDEQQERSCLRASAAFDGGVVRDVTLFPDLQSKKVLAIFAEQRPGQKRLPLGAAEILKPNKAAQEQGFPKETVAYLKKTLGVDLNATQKAQEVQKAKKGPEIG